jgi:hypothetical protein
MIPIRSREPSFDYYQNRQESCARSRHLAEPNTLNFGDDLIRQRGGDVSFAFSLSHANNNSHNKKPQKDRGLHFTCFSVCTNHSTHTRRREASLSFEEPNHRNDCAGPLCFAPSHFSVDHEQTVALLACTPFSKRLEGRATIVTENASSSVAKEGCHSLFCCRCNCTMCRRGFGGSIGKDDRPAFVYSSSERFAKFRCVQSSSKTAARFIPVSINQQQRRWRLYLR